MTTTSDPSGYLTGGQASTIVKVIDTARDDMNNKLGIVVQFNAERGRYLVHLTESQSVVAMKPENLTKAGYLEQAQAQFQQLTKDPRVRQQLQQFQQRFLPPGVQWTHVAMGSAVVFVVLVALLGFSRTMMILSLVLLGLMVIGPDLVQGAAARTIVLNLPMRFRTMVREQMPGGTTIADNNYMLAGLALLIMLFFAKALVTNPSRKASSAMPPMNFSEPPNGRSLTMINEKNMEDFYKLGWDDALAHKEYGTSLEVERNLLLERQRQQDHQSSGAFAQDADFPSSDFGHDYMPPPPPQPRSIVSKLLSLSNAMSIIYIGRTMMDLGRNADGSWSFELMKQNLTTLEPWKLGLMGFSIYRIVSVFLF